LSQASIIRKLRFGRKNDPVLTLLRRTLKEARAVARQFEGRKGLI
jgi:hypothetical protein